MARLFHQKRFEIPSNVHAVDIYDNVVAAACGHSSVRVYVGNESHFELTGHSKLVTCVSFSPDGLQLASSGWDGLINIWDMQSHERIHKLRAHFGWVHKVAWLHHNKQLVSASSDQTVILWLTVSGRAARVFRNHTSYVFVVAVSPDDHIIATGSGDNTVRLWQLESTQQLACFSNHTHSVFAVAFHPTHSNILLSGCKERIVAHDLSRKKVLFQLHTGAYALHWMPDGCFFLSSDIHTNIVTLWRFETGDYVAHFEQENMVESMAANPKADNFVVAAGKRAVCVVNVPSFIHGGNLTSEIIKNMRLLQQVLLDPRDDIITFHDLLQVQGVDVNAQDDDGDTPLHVAMHLEDKDAVQALEEAGADKSICNVANRTACQPLRIYDLLPPELWAHIIINFCPMTSVQSFSHTCREARYLLTADEGGYAHRVLHRRGLIPIINARSLAALRMYLKTCTVEKRTRASHIILMHRWDEGNMLIEELS